MTMINKIVEAGISKEQILENHLSKMALKVSQFC